LNRDIDVLVLGYYGFGNLGDELLCTAVAALLVNSGVQKEHIAILSSSPKVTESITGIQSYDRWNFSTITSLMRRSKSLLLGGGGLFQDSTSVRSCAYYWWAVRMARICGTKVWAVGQSIGPLHTFLARFFAKDAFRNCTYSSIRDGHSADIMEQWHLPFARTPDLAMGSNIKCDFVRKNTLLINIRPGYPTLAKEVACISDRLADKEKLKILGIAFAAEDATEMENIQKLCSIKFEKIVIVRTIEDFKKVILHGEKGIGMRLHFIELLLLSGLPVCGAAYDPKVSSFCNDWRIPLVGQSSQVVFSKLDLEMLNSIAENISQEFQKGLRKVLTDEN